MEQTTSKISNNSMFSVALFKSNIKRFFFIPVVFLIYYIMTNPVLIYMRLNVMQMEGMLEKTDVRDVIRSQYEAFVFPVVIMILALATMAVFSYLYFQKGTNMMHAFPITRKSMFVTNMVTSYLMIAVPMVVTTLISLPLVRGGGVETLMDMVQFTLLGLLQIFFFEGVAVFVVMCTGAIVAVPILYLILNFLYVMLYMIVMLAVSPFIFGVDLDEIKFEFLSPIVSAVNHMESLGPLYYENGTEYNPVFEHLSFFVIIAVVGIAFMVIAYRIYKNKQIESVGSLLPMAWTRPVFRWGVSFCGATLCAVFYREIFLASDTGTSAVILYIVVYWIVGFILFHGVEMIIERTVKVFSKRNVKEYILMAAVFSLFSVIASMDLFGVESRIPDVNDVDKINIYSGAMMDAGNFVDIKGNEDVEKIIGIHKDVIENKEDILYAANHTDYNPDGVVWMNFDIYYTLKSGRSFARKYDLRCDLEDKTIMPIVKEIETEVNREDRVREALFPNNALETIPDTMLFTQNKYITDGDGGFVLDSSDQYFFERDGGVIQDIWAAVLKDLDEGNIKIMDNEYEAGIYTSGKFSGYLDLTFTLKDGKEYNDYSVQIRVNDTTKNIKQALINTGQLKEPDSSK